MTAEAAVGWSVVRAVIVAAGAVALAWPLHQLLKGLVRPWARRWAWGLLLAPVLMPALLVGYGYSGLSLELVRAPGWNESLYASLLLARFAPLAALVMAMSAGGTLSRQAEVCADLLVRGAEAPAAKRPGPVNLWTHVVHGRGRAAALAAALVFLLAFAEFEIGSLLYVDGWTVWLFDAQAGGLPLSLTLWGAKWGVAVQLLVLGPIVALVPRGREQAHAEPVVVAWRTLLTGGTILAACATIAVAWPACIVALEVFAEGLAGLAAGRAVLPDVWVSLAFAGGGALGAWAVAAGLVRRRGALLVASVPGMLGSLVLGLVLLWVFQHAAFLAVYDTFVPYVLALVMLLLPAAAVLAVVLEAKRTTSVHAAAALSQASDRGVRGSGARLQWALRGRARFTAIALLMTIAYFDLPAAALLAPTGSTPASVRLYNLMHYGHNAALAGMAVLAAAALLAVVAAARVVVGVWSRAYGPRYGTAR